MGMNDFLSTIPQSPGWSIIAVLVVLIFGPLAVFSRESSEKLWVIGRLVSWFRTRQERSIERERTLEDATVRNLKWRIQSLNEQLNDMRSDFDAEREDARKRESRIRAEFADAKEYILYATSWAHQVLTMHAQHGWQPAIPPLKTFERWLTDKENN